MVENTTSLSELKIVGKTICFYHDIMEDVLECSTCGYRALQCLEKETNCPRCKEKAVYEHHREEAGVRNL